MNVFKNLTSPKVIDEIDVYTFLDYIKNPDIEVLRKIQEARLNYKLDREAYNNIKYSLPCFTLNFSFIDKKSNNTIKATTGFIYLDVDNSTDINLDNQLIFASWKSLSNNGRGILIKVDGLNLGNFKSTYKELAQKLNVKADAHAAKATQYCIHSYDKELYLNEDSITWEATKLGLKRPPLRDYPYRKDSTNMGVKKELRFNNIDEYDFQGQDYIYFDEEKELIAQVDVPQRIKEGGRNSIMYAIAYQIKALNPDLSYLSLYRIMHSINNKRCSPKLGSYELDKIIDKVDTMEDMPPETKSERRFIFNPDSHLTFEVKMKIIAPIMGERRSNKTIEEIRQCVEQWDVEIQGKLTQKTLQAFSGKNIKTIEKYYKLFKIEITEINKKYKLLKSKKFEPIF